MANLWYALHVRPRFEKLVQTNLQDKGYEVFLPTYISKRRWSDRVKSLTLPLFPSYLFCRFDVNSRLPILITPGVNCVVGVGKSPLPIDDYEIEAIRSVLKSGIAAQPHPYAKAGDWVRVEAGPLEGLTGIIVREKGHSHLIISVTLLMRSVAVEIDRAWIKPIPDPRKTASSSSQHAGCQTAAAADSHLSLPA
jgi:transcription antitermination factor NusG